MAMTRANRQRILGRADYRCEAMFTLECNGHPETLHHVQPRSNGGANHPDNLMVACRPCHGAIHKNPKRATDANFLIHLRTGQGCQWQLAGRGECAPRRYVAYLRPVETPDDRGPDNRQVICTRCARYVRNRDDLSIYADVS